MSWHDDRDYPRRRRYRPYRRMSRKQVLVWFWVFLVFFAFHQMWFWDRQAGNHTCPDGTNPTGEKACTPAEYDPAKYDVPTNDPRNR